MTSAVDLFTCAELPNEEEDPELFDLVKSLMIHGPCKGRVCHAKLWFAKYYKIMTHPIA